MKSAPEHPRESERLALLDQFQIMDTEAEQTFDELTELASTICGTPISLISLVDHERQWFKSRVGLTASETPKSIAFCSHAILQDEVFTVNNALKDDRFADNPLVTGAPDIRFYAGAPLVSHDGLPLGTLCVIDQTAKSLTGEQTRALKILAKQVVSQLELRIKNRSLQKMNENREKVFSVIAHDLRGPFNSILGFSRRLTGKSDVMRPERITEMADSILNASMTVYQLLDELLQWSLQRMGAYNLNMRRQLLSHMVDADQKLLQDSLDVKNQTLRKNFSDALEVRADATLASVVLRNLISNAIKFSPPGSAIEVQAAEVGTMVEISVLDRGPGISPVLAEQLFKGPVESHLGTYGEYGHGIGLGLCYDFVKMQGGEIWLDRVGSSGSKITFSLPRAN
ncbi:GAF domain-containing sensor histidine kinase [Simiduia aestuariiviva]|uniref:histidine kinase n=1 Tax=Simiduia aestuariiviva TaxID=1510459 RepID=A0A839UII9_9GAMM|nr:GAF domain-containing sensor histidine kinase [Simiduia aestuariiviva]MBB3167343.1 K+-sensing histidine kinase KdpD [Simiduia aestuariiviva]